MKKYNLNELKIFIITLILLAFNGCLENPSTIPVDLEFESAAELLQYLESQGDYINSMDAPSIITASSVYEKLNEFSIIDIRPQAEFTKGRIQGAVNIKPNEIISYIKDKPFEKFLIVSSSGQSAAYYTCLMRLYGINNVYSLKYGMASWHSDFADVWLRSVKDSDFLNEFNNIFYEKDKYYELPEIQLGEGNNFEEKVKSRISIMMNEEFSDIISIEQNSISVDFDRIYNSIENYYIICFGPETLYEAPGKGDEVPGHPKETVLYIPYLDFKSSRFLQTIPSNKKILVYDSNGHFSAFATAYLRLLGYDAYSVLFGANALFYNRINNPQNPNYKDAFNLNEIWNFLYEK